MERKPLPAAATVAPPRDELEWEQPTTTKKSFFSKSPFLNSGSASAKEESLENGTTQVGENKQISNYNGSFFMRNRKKALMFGGVAAIILLTLILGLGLGLGLKKSNKHRNLPLPGSTEIFTGDLTYYSPGPGYGACGFENTSHDAICAVSHIVWDAVSTSSNPNLNPLCGKKIRITRYDAAKGGNSSVDVEVVDRCTGCKPEDIDLSLDMFKNLADETAGRVIGSWAWLN